MTSPTHHGPTRSAAPVATVFGGSRGLGLRIAHEFADRGYHTVVLARDEAELQAATAQLNTSAHRADYVVCDVADREAVRVAIADIEERFGAIEACITVAGIIQVAPAEAVSFDHFDEAISIMLDGPINVAWQVLPAMRERGHGRIGTITSIGGMVSPPHLLPYATAKFGAVGFSDGLAAALQGTGVTATTVVPGLMRTGSHVKAKFAGDAPAEYAWFAPSASLPLLSMDADRAGAKIVDGVLAGRPMVVLTPLAWVGIRFRGLFPATTTRLMGVANRLLPSGDSSATVEGHDARQRRPHKLVDVLTTLGDRAAQRNNEGR